MAAITPVASDGTGGVDATRGLYTGVIIAADDLLSDGTIVNLRNNYTMEVFRFSVDDDDTWASGIIGIKAVAWQGDEGQDADNPVSASLDTINGSVRFNAKNSTSLGWLWVLIDPSLGRRSGIPTR